MKKSLLIIAAVLSIAFNSCTSKEERALSLIKNQLYDELVDLENYQPIEITIDSAFHTPHNDSVVLDYALRFTACFEVLTKTMKEINERNALYEQKLKEIEQQNAIVTNCPNQQLMLLPPPSDYLEIQAKNDSALVLADICKNKCERYEDSIRWAASCIEYEFIGWQAKHTFSCKLINEDPEILTWTYLFDKKITRIIDCEDDNHETFQKIHHFIDFALEDEKE